MADQMWTLVMFDLPVKTKRQRRSATQYRNMLLDLGFSQVQLSVYSKYLTNATGFRAIVPHLRSVPPAGAVRVLRLTDEQWSSTIRYYGAEQLQNANHPEQLLLIINDQKTTDSDACWHRTQANDDGNDLGPDGLW